MKNLKQVKTIEFITSASDFLFEHCFRLCNELLEEAIKSNDKGLGSFRSIIHFKFQEGPVDLQIPMKISKRLKN